MSRGQEDLARRLRWQMAGCAQLDAPLYAAILEACAADVLAGGPSWELLRPYANEPGTAALGLRLLACVRRLELEGRAPALSSVYSRPPATEAGRAEAARLFIAALSESAGELREQLPRPCQTNEVGRSASLLGGFLELWRRTGLPLRLLELGASAGLNLRWDRYYYSGGGASWGDPGSPVRLETLTQPPPLTGRPRIAERAGCDLAPVDLAEPGAATLLRSFVWPEHRQRLARLEGALQVARELPLRVDRADAVDWLAERLGTPAAGRATVVFHSVFMQYLPEPGRRRLASLLRQAGGWASVDAPLAWLRLEPGEESFEVRMTVWPDGVERLLATSSPHGSQVRWVAG